MTDTNAKAEDIRRNPRTREGLAAFDRKILSQLATDATVSLAAIGQEVGLSAPAVHERVKRLRANGTISGTVATLNGDKVGKPLLAFVHVTTRGWGKSPAMVALAELPEVEELHSITGDSCILLKVRCASPAALEGLLARIYDLDGVQHTRSHMVLSTYLERTTQATTTEDLIDGPFIR